MASSKTREVLWSVLQDLPDDLVDEVADFVQFLRLRHVVPDTTMLSEAALAAAWLTPDEDEAWERLVAGDVIVGPFPFTNLARAKRRPAFVLAALADGDYIF